MSDVKKTIANAVILSVTKGTWTKKGETEEREKHEIVAQNADNPAEVVSMVCFGKLTDDIVPQGKVTNLEYEVNDFNGTITNRVRFGEKKDWKGGGGGYGAPKEDPALKCVSFAFAYAKEILLTQATTEWNWETYFQKADETAAAMMQTYKALRS